MVAVRGHGHHGAGAAIGAAVLGLTLGPPQSHVAYAQPALRTGQRLPVPNRGQSDPVGSHDAAQRIALALEDRNRYDESAKSQRDARKAANAAHDAAVWAQALFWAGCTETAVTFAGVVLVYFTLKEAQRSANEAKRGADEMKRSADFAETGLKDSRERGEAETRAYVFVHRIVLKLTKKGKTVGVTGQPGRLPRFPTGQISFTYENTGRTPAKNVRLGARAVLVPTGQPIDVAQVGPLGPIGPLGPKSVFSRDIPIENCPQNATLIENMTRNGSHQLHFIGRIEYDTIFSENRFTSFHCAIGGPIGYDRDLHAWEPGNDYS